MTNDLITLKTIGGEIIYECYSESIKTSVESAVNCGILLKNINLDHTDLHGINLSGLDLSGASFYNTNLSNANLSNSYLKGSNLQNTILKNANMSNTNLISANLEGANLKGTILNNVDLREANLSKTITDKRYIQISCIGCDKEIIIYCFDDDIVWYGCFRYTLEKFEIEIIKKNEYNNQYLKEYLGFINYIKNLK